MSDKSQVFDIRTSVSDKLSTSNTAVRHLVVEELTTQEINKRKDAVLSLLTKSNEKLKELLKAENQGTYALNLKGEKIGEPSFTREQVEAAKKLREELEKIDTALTNFFEKNDTGKLYELGKK